MFGTRRFSLKPFRSKFQYNLSSGGGGIEFTSSNSQITEPITLNLGSFRIHRVEPNLGVSASERNAKTYQIWAGNSDSQPIAFPSSPAILGDAGSTYKSANPNFYALNLGMPVADGILGGAAFSMDWPPISFNNTWWYIGGLPYVG